MDKQDLDYGQTSELMQKYPTLSGMKNWHFVSAEKQKEYEGSKSVSIISPENSNTRIYIGTQTIQDIVTDYSLFTKIRKFFADTNASGFSFVHDEGGELVATVFTKHDIIKALQTMLANEKIDTFAGESVEKALLPHVSFDVLKKVYTNKTYQTEIDGKEISIPASDLIEIITDINGFSNIMKSGDTGETGLSTTEYLYALNQFVKDESIISRFNFPDVLIHKYHDLSNFKICDFEAINQYQTTTNPYMEKVEINPELRERILADMPEDYSDIEKCMYIYIQMCKTLTYDQEYYVTNQRGPRTEKHKTLSYIPTITTDHNNAVCYEFSSIYGKLLNEMGIKHEFVETYLFGEKLPYGDGHTYLTFRCGKYLVNADSVTSILNSDMTNAKIDRQLNGITCLNKNVSTKADFKAILEGVQEDIQQIEFQKSQKASQSPATDDEFANALEKYQSMTEQSRIDTPLQEKLDLIFSQIEEYGLSGLDAYTYLMQLRKTVLTKAEQNDNVAINLLKKETESLEEPAEAVAIITISDDYHNKESENTYLTFSSSTGAEEISKRDLQDLFSRGIYSYIAPTCTEVPGIDAPVIDEFIGNPYE